jgi:hypothetical protein
VYVQLESAIRAAKLRDFDALLKVSVRLQQLTNMIAYVAHNNKEEKSQQEAREEVPDEDLPDENEKRNDLAICKQNNIFTSKENQYGALREAKAKQL